MTAGVRALTIWICAAVAFGVALVGAQFSAGPLDDPVAAHQRSDLLDSVGRRDAAPLVTISRPATGRATVVFFVRDAQQRPLLAALSRPQALPASVEAVVVGGRPDLAESRYASVSDVDAALARGYDMPVPRDGGYPVGYAIVGRDGTIRYRTLDPRLTEHLAELRTLLTALQ